MPAQLTLRSPKGGRVIAEREYADGHRIDASSGWLVVVDRNGSVIAAHAACPGLEAALVEHSSSDAPYPVGETATYPTDDGIALDDGDAPGLPHGDEPAEETLARRLAHEGDEALDEQVGRLADWIMENVDGEPSQSQGAVDTAIRLLDAWQRQIEALRDEVARLGAEPASAGPGIIDAYRREINEQATRAEKEDAARLAAEDTNRHLREKLREAREVADAEHWRAEREAERGNGAFVIVDRLREFVANLAAENWTANADDRRWVLQRPARIASSIEEQVLGERVPTDLPRGALPDRVPHEPIDLRPVEEDPRRPSLDHYPSDAILLTYREVRRLVGLHLEACSGEPHLARAMLDGETGLRLAEVLA